MKNKIGSSKSIKKYQMAGQVGTGRKAIPASSTSSMMDKIASGVKNIATSPVAQTVKKIVKSAKFKKGGTVGKYQMGGTSTSKVPSKYPRKVPEMEGMKKPISPMRPPERAKYGGSMKSKNC